MRHEDQPKDGGHIYPREHNYYRSGYADTPSVAYKERSSRVILGPSGEVLRRVSIKPPIGYSKGKRK